MKPFGHSLLASHSVDDASFGMPMKSYCYGVNLHDLSAKNARLNLIHSQTSFSPFRSLLSPRSQQRIFLSPYPESSTCQPAVNEATLHKDISLCLALLSRSQNILS